MRLRFGNLTRRLASFAVPPLIAVIVGVAVAIASNPGLLTRERGAGTNTGGALPTPSPTGSHPPSVTSPGVLGDGARLVAGPSGVLFGLAPNLVEESSDSGKTWTILRPPSNGSGIAVDPADPRHAITGGSTVRVTANSGGTWGPARTAPPGLGPYQPFQVSPFDGTVWFLLHQQKLLRTRDASLTWRELTTDLPPLATPVMAPGTDFGQFFLASGNRVFELTDNGQVIHELPTLPQGVTVTDLVVVSGDTPTVLARGGKDNAYLLVGNVWSVAGGGLTGPVAVGANGVLLVGNGGAKLGSPGAVSYRTTARSTWARAVGLPYDQSVEAIAAQPDSGMLFAYCYGGDIYTSSDGGRSWTLLTRALRTTAG